MARPPDLSALQTRLDYTFADASLLQQALTHGSIASKSHGYERLEFLGDRVLGLVIADELLRLHAREPEGKLAARLSALVRAEVCAQVGEAMGLPDFVHVGVKERQAGVNRMQSVLADAVEAVIGAVYIDGGLEHARRLVLHFWDDHLKHPGTAIKDAKTFVQEWALGKSLSLPRYEIASRSGPEHKPSFTVRIHLEKHDTIEGIGPSKQSAEMAAATAFIAREGLR